MGLLLLLLLLCLHLSLLLLPPSPGLLGEQRGGGRHRGGRLLHPVQHGLLLHSPRLPLCSTENLAVDMPSVDQPAVSQAYNTSGVQSEQFQSGEKEEERMEQYDAEALAETYFDLA